VASLTKKVAFVQQEGRQEEQKMAKKKADIKSLYYITHVENLRSIMEHGILSHRLVEDRQIDYSPIYDPGIVNKRRQRTAPDGRSLWEFANVYFQPRNPMLYRVVHERDVNEIAIIGIRPAVMSQPGTFVALGNAASVETQIVRSEEGRQRVAEIWDVIHSEWWSQADGSKRKIMAECLVPEKIPPQMIHTIYVASHQAADRVRGLGVSNSISIVPEPHIFFRPARQVRLTKKLTLAEGDMFFSHMQTLTVSVNLVGVMGKGLASRAKYQFPDVYVIYQDACRRRKLRMGRPYLYKRETLVDDELADEPETLSKRNDTKWFLLFATKRHWREKADLNGIKEGLRWVRENYKSEGIRSLALPALGCGLGKLKWEEVGPVMCRELSDLEIDVVIYLPRERKIPEKYLTPEYLLPEEGANTHRPT